ncbi:MAG: glycosyltransferase family 4 protein [Chloroflexi bacterium]|nr:glycosyltransferase family 4 protein [Anaerolineaceae bacterium]NMB90026.1 glycosyltransferase family 4 protein [Chloroflexota bacterium]
MRVLIHDYGGYPFSIHLGRELSLRGHEICYVYNASIRKPMGAVSLRAGDPGGLSIHSIHLDQQVQRYAFLKRWQQERAYGQLLVREVDQFRPDIVLSCNCPLDAQQSVVNYCQRHEIPFVYWLQDLLGVAAKRILRKKLFLVGSLIGEVYTRMELKMLQQANFVISITDDFLPSLEMSRVARERVEIIPNWAPLEETPRLPRQNPWAQQNGLADKMTLLYTGNLGMKHNPGLFVHLAEHFRKDPRVRIVVVSEGLGADWLKARRAENQLDNLLVFDYQPYEKLAEVLASGDVLMAVLENEAGEFSVPSKALAYFCAGRPLLLAVPLKNQAARLVMGNEAGVVVPPGCPKTFVLAAEFLLQNPDLREYYASKAYSYAHAGFQIGQIGDRFEQILTRV